MFLSFISYDTSIIDIFVKHYALDTGSFYKDFLLCYIEIQHMYKGSSIHPQVFFQRMKAKDAEFGFTPANCISLKVSKASFTTNPFWAILQSL